MFWQPFARVDRVLPADADKSELSPGFCYSTPVVLSTELGSLILRLLMWKMKIWRGVVRKISEGDITSGIWRAVVTSSLLVSLPPSHLPLNVVVLLVVVVLVLLLIAILLLWLSLLLKSFLFGDHEASNTKRQV